jgi:sterol desaturase/sphingolipid hydroxylase (fatty acid hydroxylase superfamily)
MAEQLSFVPTLPNPVDWAIPAFIALIVAEMIWAQRQKPAGYEPRDTLTSLLFGLGSTVTGLLAAGTIGTIAFAAYDLRLASIPFVWWAWIACFVLDDLLYYAFHRSAHRVRWFWASHVNHHSSQHYNLSTALRQTWTGFFALSFIFRLPLLLIGFHPVMVLFCGGLNLIYQYWIHTEAIGKMPRWFEAIMNTPSHHRVHHATNPRYLDANYAGVFIIWDRIFGSYVPEDDADQIRYGLVKQVGSFNVLYSVFHEWIGIARDIWTAPWHAKLGYMFGPPGWSHDGSRETSQDIKKRAAQLTQLPNGEADYGRI